MRRKTTTQTVTRRTAARRARKHEALAQQREQARQRVVEPETIGQARVWERKFHRYQIAGLCNACASQAAWGHAMGFGKIKDPCAECQPIVNAFPNDGPRGSKWRKCLIKLEYLSEAEVKEIFS